MRATSTAKIGLDGKPDPNGRPDPNSNRDNSNVAPGQRKILLDAKGPGVITHIWMTFLGPEPQPWAKKGSANHQEMLLRMYWDGREKPAVEAPVGDFFANSFGKRSEVISLPVIVEDADSYNCFWHMPFRKSARIEIVNQSEKPISLLYYNIDWIKKESLRKDTPYFYAQYRQEYPVEKGKDYVILETKGKGHYVGTVLSVRTRSPSWFGEGDEKIYIDGEDKASIWGTGTEDYFLSAWGLKTTSTPYFGVPYFDQWGIVGGHTSAYRWHINDPLVFNKGIKVTIEHFGWMSPDENPQYRSHSWNEREDDYSSVAFWYQTGEPTFTARAPHARERTLPNLDRLIVAARDFTDEKHHGQGEAVAQNLDLYPKGHLLLQAPAAGERLGRDSVRGREERAAAPAARHDARRRLRQIPGVPQRREAGRRHGPLQSEKSRPASTTCWISGPSPASTPCGWSASARTPPPAAIISASSPSACGSVVPASAITITTPARTGTRIPCSTNKSTTWCDAAAELHRGSPRIPDSVDRSAISLGQEMTAV